jgi:transcriptional repressor NrdR
MGVYYQWDIDRSKKINIRRSTLRCPHCQHDHTKVIDTTHDNRGGVRRRRECNQCHQRFSTYERAILATPLVIKQDGTREDFDREKLLRGIRIACAKRPVSAADIEHLVGEIESSLQKLGRAEVSSRVIGDRVITGLKELDQIAYIRYAIVYLRLDDLQEIRNEIDRLLV